MHVTIAKGASLQEVWQRGLQEMHPPGAHFIRHLFFSLDDSLITNRLLSIIPAVISIVLIYLIGIHLYNPSMGLLLATFQLFSVISVTYSISIRNYALFIVFLYASILFLVIYFKERDKKFLLGYSFFIFLACITHFSGFIVLAATGSTLALLFCKEKNLKLLRYCILIHLPHFIIALLFYQAYFSTGSVGEGWREFLRTNPVIKVFYDNEKLPLHYRILHLLYGFFVRDFTIAIILGILSIYGVFICFIKNRAIAALILLLFIIQIVLNTLAIYPIVGSRYNYHLFLFISITLGFSFVGIQRVFSSHLSERFYETLLVTVIIIFTFYFYTEHPHLNKNYELPLTKNTYASGIKYLQSSLQENEIVITNKIGGLYLNFEKNHGNVMYQHKPISHIQLNQLSVWYQSKPYLWEYQTPQSFDTFLADLNQKLPSISTEKVWLLIIGLTDFALNTIYNCDLMKASIENEFFEDGFLVFSIKTEALFSQDLVKKERLRKCWESSKVSGNADFLHAI